jgi:hypothetical protein
VPNFATTILRLGISKLKIVVVDNTTIAAIADVGDSSGFSLFL